MFVTPAPGIYFPQHWNNHNCTVIRWYYQSILLYLLTLDTGNEENIQPKDLPTEEVQSIREGHIFATVELPKRKKNQQRWRRFRFPSQVYLLESAPSPVHGRRPSFFLILFFTLRRWFRRFFYLASCTFVSLPSPFVVSSLTCFYKSVRVWFWTLEPDIPALFASRQQAKSICSSFAEHAVCGLIEGTPTCLIK